MLVNHGPEMCPRLIETDMLPCCAFWHCMANCLVKAFLNFVLSSNSLITATQFWIDGSGVTSRLFRSWKAFIVRSSSISLNAKSPCWNERRIEFLPQTSRPYCFPYEWRICKEILYLVGSYFAAMLQMPKEYWTTGTFPCHPGTSNGYVLLPLEVSL